MAGRSATWKTTGENILERSKGVRIGLIKGGTGVGNLDRVSRSKTAKLLTLLRKFGTASCEQADGD